MNVPLRIHGICKIGVAMRVKGITVWQKSDLDGFFGLFTNNITNILVMVGALVYTVGMPVDLVYGRIMPALGVGMVLCSACYFYFGYRMARKEGRDTVTAMPTGISVPHMFLVIYMIILPVHLATGDPVLAWQAGLAWCFVEAVVKTVGAFMGAWLRRVLPRAAMLGSVAGASITVIMTNNAVQSFTVPYIALVSFCVILLGYIAKRRMPFGLPAGLVAIVLGTVIGWVSGYMTLDGAAASLSSLGLYLPAFCGGDIIEGMAAAAPFLASAIPLGIYNFTESIDNVESAAAAGDHYNTTHVLLANGVTNIVSSVLGSPIPTAVYIGHPGWKSIGARLGYCLINGVAIFAISLLGIISVLISVIPLPALLPILIYIGVSIGAQAFEAVPKKHYAAVIVAILPWLASWGLTMIDNVVSASGAGEVSLEAFQNAGVYYAGFKFLGDGAAITSLLWAALVVFLMEGQLRRAAVSLALCCGLTFFGLMHAQTVSLFQSPEAVVGYVLMIALCVVVMKFGKKDADSESAQLCIEEDN